MTPEIEQAYKRALDRAEEIFAQRDATGRNAVVPLERMFPHGPQDLTFMLYNKASRCLGLAATPGGREKLIEESVDIINYAAFLIMMLEGAWPGSGS